MYMILLVLLLIPYVHDPLSPLFNPAIGSNARSLLPVLVGRSRPDEEAVGDGEETVGAGDAAADGSREQAADFEGGNGLRGERSSRGQ